MKLQTIALSLIGLTFAITSINAQGRHPAYLRARSDIRRAQVLMRVREGDPNVLNGLRAADRDAENAVHEIDVAAVLDRKDLDDHPPVDTSIDRRGRFHKIVDLLRSARADIAREEDNGGASIWRNRAYSSIDASLFNMRVSAKAANLDRELGF